MNALVLLWQLPQVLLGWILRLFYPAAYTLEKDGVTVIFSDKFHGGLSLGTTVFVHSHVYTWNEFPLDTLTVRHELGHSRQSRTLGWFYLLVIGLPSILHAWLYRRDPADPDKYYRFYTEAWADRLAGINR